MPHFAANLTTLFTELPFAERFRAAADAGFAAVECLFPYELAPEAIADLLRRHELELALFNLPPGDWAANERGLAALADREGDFQISVRTALTYATATGCRRLHVMAGIADVSDAGARELYCRRLGWAADEAAKSSILVLIEPLNPGDMPGYFLNDFDTALEIIEQCDRPNIRLQFDIYHRQLLHSDVSRAIKKLLPRIGHFQVASVPERHEPGTGELNDFHIFALIDRLGYDGFVGCEYRPAGDTRHGLAWLDAWRATGGQSSAD